MILDLMGLEQRKTTTTMSKIVAKDYVDDGVDYADADDDDTDDDIYWLD